MEAPPLTLSVLHLRPSTLLLPPDDEPQSPSPIPPSPVTPSQPIPTFSATYAYPAPYPDASLGSTLALSLDLCNTKPEGPVMGVRMMCEVQSPNGRYRLGEVVHGQKEDEKPIDPSTDILPELQSGEGVKLEVEGELKELGLHVVIVSVAWETLDGRRTFQRFFKFNVNPPLAIKTRIHQAQHPNTSLDLGLRERVYLEILAQNVSPEGMVFDKVFLEAVNGLEARQTSTLAEVGREANEAEGNQEETKEGGRTLMPGETRQYLFVLTPKSASSETDKTDNDAGSSQHPKSTFPATHQPGTILPLGRLDLTWRSGPSHDPGRLQTSTLNRRIPVSAIPPTRTLSAASPVPAARLSPAPQTPGGTSRRLGDKFGPTWEFDLVLLDRPKAVMVEKDFLIKLRVGVRTTSMIDEELDELTPPPPPILGIQYLTKPPPKPLPSLNPAQPRFTLSPPSRSSTPLTRADSAASNAGISRSFSPLSQVSNMQGSTSMSRPMTPVSSQLRQATSSHIGSPSTASLSLLPPAPVFLNSNTSFPPLPLMKPSVASISSASRDRLNSSEIRGEVQHLGNSLEVVRVGSVGIVEEKSETTYTNPIAPLRRWEATIEHTTKFFALDEGMAELGGLRILVLNDDKASSGSTGREWESLGDIWVDG